jgi:hypothetical protein
MRLRSRSASLTNYSAEVDPRSTPQVLLESSETSVVLQLKTNRMLECLRAEGEFDQE